MQTTTKTKNLDDNSETQWSDIIDLKSKLNDDNTVDCVIKSVDINKEYADLEITPIGTDIKKNVRYNSKVNLNKKSDFEIFVEKQGIAPTENNIEDKLLGSTVEFNISINENHIEFNDNVNTVDDYFTKERIKKLKYIFIGFTITSLSLIAFQVVLTYGIIDTAMLFLTLIFFIFIFPKACGPM